MNLLTRTLRQVSADLHQLRRPWALVGGLAIAARAEPRFTRDVDIAVSVDGDSGAEELVHALIRQGYGLVASIEQDATGRLATVRLERSVVDGDEVIVDLLFASSGIEQEIAAAAEQLEIVPGLTVPVARTGHLIALKVLARDDVTRPQDLSDLNALAGAAADADLALARTSVQVITERGFHRGRDLVAALNEILAER